MVQNKDRPRDSCENDHETWVSIKCGEDSNFIILMTFAKACKTWRSSLTKVKWMDGDDDDDDDDDDDNNNNNIITYTPE